MSKTTYALFAIFLLTFAAGGTALGQLSVEVVALSGDPAPDGNGSFAEFSVPALNDLGQVAFTGTLVETSGDASDDSGLFRYDSASSLVQIARAGQAAPDGNGVFSDFGTTPALNNVGQSAFLGVLTGTSDGELDSTGIYIGDGASSLMPVVRAGNPAPDGNGKYWVLRRPTLNDMGQSAFFSVFRETSGISRDNRAIILGDGISTAVQVARGNDPTPDGNGFFVIFSDPPTLNNFGQVAISGTIRRGSNDGTGIYLGDGTGPLVKIIRTGDPGPDGDGIFSRLFDPALNDVGQAAFSGSVSGVSNQGEYRGLFRADGKTSVVQIARSGDTSPDGNGTFNFSFDVPTINEAGQVAFNAVLRDTSDGSFDNRGIYRGDGTSIPTLIAREGNPTPDGNGKFSHFEDLALNDAGQIAFLSKLRETNDGETDDHGLYLYDDLLGLTQVARTGGDLFGSTIIDLEFVDRFSPDSDERKGFNNLGQIAYRFELADGRQGIAIVSVVPEPGTLLLGLSVSCTLVMRRKR